MNTDTQNIVDIPVAAPAPAQPLSVITGGRTVSVFEKAAETLLRRPDASFEQLQQIMQMHERWLENEARMAFVEAMARFKENPPEILKDKFVGYENRDGTKTGYHHATLGAVCDAVIAGLAQVGISHSWKPKQTDGKVGVTCVLTHRMGHREDDVYIEAPADTSGKKNAIQSVGSTITFLERYTLLAAVGLATKDMDNDGQDHVDPRKDFDWVDEYLLSIASAGDLPSLMASWKTAVAACRRREDRRPYDDFKDAVTKRCGELGISAEEWAAAAAGGKKP